MSEDNFLPRGQIGFNVRDINGHDVTALVSGTAPDADGYVWTHNRVVNQGLNHFLNVGLRGEGLISTFYMAPFAANVAPAATVTAATFASTLTEFTNYTEAARPQWVSDGASTAQTLTNATAPSLFTVSSGAQTTIYGAGLLSVAGKEATTGTLIAAGRLPTALTGLAEGYEVRLRYRITGTSA